MSALVFLPFAVSSGYIIVLLFFLGLVVAILIAVRVLDTRRGVAPRFELTLDVERADADGVVVMPARSPTAELRVHAGVANVGPTPAGRTTVYVVVPRTVDARWIGAQTGYTPELTGELLPIGEHQVDAWYLRGVLPRVDKGDNPVVTLVLEAPIPSELPIRFRAVAKGLANGDDAEIDRLFVVRDS